MLVDGMYSVFHEIITFVQARATGRNVYELYLMKIAQGYNFPNRLIKHTWNRVLKTCKKTVDCFSSLLDVIHVRY